jgi:hypothetical protein
MLRINIKNDEFLSVSGGVTTVYCPLSGASAENAVASNVIATPLQAGVTAAYQPSASFSPSAGADISNDAAGAVTKPMSLSNTVSPMLDPAPAGKAAGIGEPNTASVVLPSETSFIANSTQPLTSAVQSDPVRSETALPVFSTVASVTKTVFASETSFSTETAPAPAADETAAAPETAMTPQTASSAAAAPNKIALENLKQGNPRSEWGIDGDGDANIQGFCHADQHEYRPDG